MYAVSKEIGDKTVSFLRPACGNPSSAIDLEPCSKLLGAAVRGEANPASERYKWFLRELKGLFVTKRAKVYRTGFVRK